MQKKVIVIGGVAGGDVHLELDTLLENHTSLPKDRPIITYCDYGSKGYNAEQMLKHFGYDVYQLDGGYNIYTKEKGNN